MGCGNGYRESIPRMSGGEPLSAALFFLAAKVIPCASGGEPSVFEGYKTIIEFSLRQRGDVFKESVDLKSSAFLEKWFLITAHLNKGDGFCCPLFDF